ncbi:hypothetical protein Tco_0950071, partial [Tanacetum coccineum]
GEDSRRLEEHFEAKNDNRWLDFFGEDFFVIKVDKVSFNDTSMFSSFSLNERSDGLRSGKLDVIRTRGILRKCEAQESIVEFDNAHWEAVGDAFGVEDELRTSAINKERELFEDDFVSGSEEEVDEVEYESDGAQIIEQYGQDEN